MNRAAFDFFADLLRRESGMNITPEKYYLLESRLFHIAQQQGVQGLEGLAAQMRREQDNLPVRQAVIEAMMTHETSFFRDGTPFDQMRQLVLPHFRDHIIAGRPFRIWSAACATGQEPYSLAMLLHETAWPLAQSPVDIVATDLSHDVIAQALRAAYSQFDVQRGMPVKLLVKYFTHDKGRERWVLSDDIRRMVTFRQLNLLSAGAPDGVFDVVFCRNMLMYLDSMARVKILQRLYNATHPGSVLFLGAAENVSGLSDLFNPLPDYPGVFVRGDTTFKA